MFSLFLALSLLGRDGTMERAGWKKAREEKDEWRRLHTNPVSTFSRALYNSLFPTNWEKV